MRGTVFAPLVALVLVLTLLGCASEPAAPAAPAEPKEPESFDTTGSISAPNGYGFTVGEQCVARSPYDDIEGGAQVVVKDDSGKTVAVSALDYGVADSRDVCRFDFELEDLVEADFYSIEIGNNSRGGVESTNADMKAGPEFSIGL